MFGSLRCGAAFPLWILCIFLLSIQEGIPRNDGARQGRGNRTVSGISRSLRGFIRPLQRQTAGRPLFCAHVAMIAASQTAKQTARRALVDPGQNGSKWPMLAHPVWPSSLRLVAGASLSKRNIHFFSLNRIFSKLSKIGSMSRALAFFFPSVRFANAAFDIGSDHSP